MWNSKKRTIFLHGHMFKNAGSSIHKILRHNFGEKFVAHLEDEKMIEGGQVYIEDYLRMHENIQALSSHSLPMPIVSTDNMEFKTIIMLRDPIVRVASVYRFEQKQQVDTPGAIAAKKYNMQDYIKWRFDERPSVITNYFSNYLTTTLAKNGCSEATLETALNVIEQVYFVGIVERFDESMKILASRTKKLFPKFVVQDARENVTDTRKISNEQRKEEIQELIGSTLYTRLLEANKTDQALYNLVRDQFGG